MTFATADVRFGHGAPGLGAGGLDDQLAAKAQKTLYHAPGQCEVFAGIGAQNGRDGTGAADIGLPVGAVGVGLGQPANLLIATAMKVGIVEFAILPVWRAHEAIILCLKSRSNWQ